MQYYTKTIYCKDNQTIAMGKTLRKASAYAILPPIISAVESFTR